MKSIAKLCLVLLFGVSAGCATHSPRGGCCGNGSDSPSAYRESAYDSERYAEPREYPERAKAHQPGDVIETSRTTAPRDAAPAVTYTCPMHPEVTQPSPGKCPKCGMELIAR